MSTAPFQPLPNKTDNSLVRIGVVVARWNQDITSELLKGCVRGLEDYGVAQENIVLVECPGAFEIPVLVKHIAVYSEVQGIVAIGAVIRGETAHFEYVAEPVSHALQTLAVEHGIPIGFCVLATNTEQQAIDRAGGKHGNKGYETALTVLETIQSIKLITSGKS